MVQKNSQEEVDLTVISPVYNEFESLNIFIEKLIFELNLLQVSFEIILVDDGSSDESWSLIESLVGRNPQIRGIRLAQNMGQMAALEVGMRNATGSWFLTMDSDLQHPPVFIKQMWNSRKGVKIVNTRQLRREEAWQKAFAANLFYRLIGLISYIPVESNVGDFRLIDSSTAKWLLGKREPKIMRFLAPKYKVESVTLDYQANAREAGQTKYTWKKMVRVGIQSFLVGSEDFFFIFLKAGVFALMVCVTLASLAILSLIFSWAITLPAMILSAGLFIMFIGLTSIGILGVFLQEYCKSISNEAKNASYQLLGFGEK